MKPFLALFAIWLFATNVASGQTPAAAPPATDFDCWIGSDGPPYYTHYIRCMADRDIAPEASMDARRDALLDLLHGEVHGGSSAGAERLYHANGDVVREAGGIWNIRIHSYPSDWSWQEGMPERLVRGVLCPDPARCTLLLRR